MEELQIDGSFGEGGGQILRSSLTLSIITGRPFHLTNIRAGRSEPGLAPQHLTCIESAAKVCSAKTRGAAVRSRQIWFSPEKSVSGDYDFEVSTAGAMTLVMQTVAIPLALSGKISNLNFIGGTHVPWSPPYHYLERAWSIYMQKIGISIYLSLDMPGFYPKGGGRFSAVINPCKDILPLNITQRGQLVSLSGLSLVGNLPISIAHRQADSAIRFLERHGFKGVKVECKDLEAFSPGTMLLVIANYENCVAAFSALGEKKKRAEQVGEEACEKFMDYANKEGAVDYHMADQLLVPLALAKGLSSYTTTEITQHLLTNAHIVTMFTGVPIKIEGNLGEQGTIHIQGK